jgi:hypothetical protein
VFGRFMRDDKPEYPCEVINMSARGMALLSPVACADQERIVAYLDKFGRIEGVVVRPSRAGLPSVSWRAPAKCEKIANSLTWITNEKALGLTDKRSYERVAVANPSSKLILPSGEVHACKVIDVSLSGASIAIEARPPVNTMVILGRMRGRVVRHHDQGVGIQFATRQDPDSLARSFG